MNIAKGEAGLKLLSFLKIKYGHLSVKQLKRIIDTGSCFINGKIEKFSTRILKPGDRVICNIETRAQEPLTIIYEDEELLICNKAAGWLSDNSIFNYQFPQFKGKLELVHRLDKDTSGLIILAKQPAMRVAMEALFKAREVKKKYLALVQGVVHPPEGVIENFLIKKGEIGGMALWGSGRGREAKKAITYWKCLKTGNQTSLLQLEPHTGRTHQLRVHLSEWNHPILGEVHYSKKRHAIFQPKRHLLHAWKIIFIHPFRNITIQVAAPIPHDFQESLSHLSIDYKFD